MKIALLTLAALLVPADLPGDVSEDARTSWERFLAATRPEQEGAIHALSFDVEVLTRMEGQATEAGFSLAYLDPDRLRMRTKSGIEQGVGSGIGQKAYWLRKDDELVRLVGRDYETDRRQLDDLLNLCHDLCVLANPETLRVTTLEDMRRAPRELGGHRHAAKKLDWVVFTSPDFQLVRSGSGELRVELGLDPETGVAAQAVVRDPKHGAAPRHLVFEGHAALDGFTVPRAIHVFDTVDPADPSSDFRRKATIEIYLLSGELNPELAPESFDPQ